MRHDGARRKINFTNRTTIVEILIFHGIIKNFDLVGDTGGKVRGKIRAYITWELWESIQNFKATFLIIVKIFYVLCQSGSREKARGPPWLVEFNPWNMPVYLWLSNFMQHHVVYFSDKWHWHVSELLCGLLQSATIVSCVCLCLYWNYLTHSLQWQLHSQHTHYKNTQTNLRNFEL